MINCILKLGLVVAMLSIGAVAKAQVSSYPENPIRIVVPWPPGGAGDFLARVIAEGMSKKLSQTVLVENKPGANTNIGTQFVARAKPDGYTLLLASSNNAVNMTLFPNLDFDFSKAFKPISNIASAPNVLVVNAQSPAKDAQQLSALAKKNPENISYGSSGTGSASHLAAEMYSRSIGIKILGVPYKGSSQAITDLLANRLSMMFTVVPTILSNTQAGKLRALCVLSDKRLAAMPTVPTADEAGLKGLRSDIWYGIVAPAGTPDPIINKLNSVIAAVIKDKDVIQKLESQGTIPIGDTSEQFSAKINSDIGQYMEIIKSANITIDG